MRKPIFARLIPDWWQRFPMSRDFDLDIDCRRTSCVNSDGSGKCAVPSQCSIGEDGRCEGYRAR